MAKLTKTSLFKASGPTTETPIDKTTRIVREIVDGEAEQRQVKMARLRKARLEREASTAVKPSAATPAKARKKPVAKAVKEQ